MISKNWRFPDGSFVRRVVDTEFSRTPPWIAFRANGEALSDDEGDTRYFGTWRLAAKALFPGGAGYMIWCRNQE